MVNIKFKKKYKQFLVLFITTGIHQVSNYSGAGTTWWYMIKITIRETLSSIKKFNTTVDSFYIYFGRLCIHHQELQ
jgi:hypothetical protein